MVSALAGCGAQGPPTAIDVARQAVEAQMSGEPRLAWRTLDAADRRLVSRGEFTRCALLGRGRGPIKPRIGVVDAEPLRIGGHGAKGRHVTQVRLAVTVEVGRPQQEAFADYILIDVVKTDGRWRWLLDRLSARLYATSRVAKVCPDVAGSTTPGR